MAYVPKDAVSGAFMYEPSILRFSNSYRSVLSEARRLPSMSSCTFVMVL
ncbi:hypothetical protein ABH904_001687 [Pseudomonas frederiksbergensis]